MKNITPAINKIDIKSQIFITIGGILLFGGIGCFLGAFLNNILLAYSSCCYTFGLIMAGIGLYLRNKSS